MCGRYASFREAQKLKDTFGVEEITAAASDIEASYNVAPTSHVRIVVDRLPKEEQEREGEPRRELHAAYWGLIPGWAKDRSIGARMINARSETLAEKRSFAKPLERRRCLVVADGYYEWRKDQPAGGAKMVKTPFYIYPTDRSPIAFAGLYSWWPDPDKAEDDPARWVLSTTIITQDARDGLEEIHDREPAVLDHGLLEQWLDPARTDPTGALELLERPSPPLSWHEVDRAVGSVRNNTPSLIDPVRN